MRSVVLAGGGTAGHVEPALALADALRAEEPGVRITLLGTEAGLEARLVPGRGYELATVPRVPLPRRFTPGLLTVPGRLMRAVGAAADVLDRVWADVVVGFGGYVALPAYLAARRRHVPSVVHEANPLPGIANRFGARLTPYVAVSHPETPLRGGRLTGIPLRSAVLDLDRSFAARRGARASFGLDPDRMTLLVFGGSQGAQHINDVTVRIAADLTAAGVQVLHVAGPKNAGEVSSALPPRLPAPYVVRPYLDQISPAYAAADLALCRSGAMTCAELAAIGLPAIYVPLPIGNGEQRLNAMPTVQAGGGLLVDDAELTPEWARAQLLTLLAAPDRLVAMSGAARRSAHTGAARQLLTLVREAAGTARPRPGRRPARHVAR